MDFFKTNDFDRFVVVHNVTAIDGSTIKEITIDVGNHIADQANRVLQERGVRVYGIKNPNISLISFDISAYLWRTNKQNISYDDFTHQAWLTGIEELPKKECEHGPKEERICYDPAIGGYQMRDVSICHKCGIKLKAKWEALNEHS